MAKKKLRPGVGARCSSLIKFLHPSKRVGEVPNNCSYTDRLHDLLTIKMEQKHVNKRMQECIVFRHDSFPNEELYCVRKFCKVVSEGPAANIFETEPEVAEVVLAAGAPVRGVATEALESTGTALPDGVQNFRDTPEDISLMREMGFDVDDDNDPAPENVPGSALGASVAPSRDGLYEGQSWGWNGFCDRRQNHFASAKPRLKGLQETMFLGLTYLDLFLLFFPRMLVQLVLQETNKKLKQE